MASTLDSMRTTRTYKDAITLLNSLQSNFAAIEAAKSLSISPAKRSELSINEVREYIRRLGYQPKDFNKLNIIHVTGTKGKGSTCAFTESILSQYKKSGHINKIGLFTSPHLKSVRERIRLNGAPITESKFTKYFYEVWDMLSTTTSDPEEFPTLQPCDTVKPMYFKYLTVLSFHVFISEGVDTAIYEVGVGGKFDSTNIIDKPTVAAITSLGIDHTHMLGNTIESIAWNKAGIFKSNCPAIASEQNEYPESLKVVEKVARENGVSSFEIVSANLIPRDLELGLAGEFQKLNAAVAVKAAQIHLQHLGVNDVNINDLPDEFIVGLETARWDGRCQIVKDFKEYEGITWYIDGAHTLESINVACNWYGTTSSSIGNPKVLLFNQQSRENAKDLLERLYDVIVKSSDSKFDHVIFTTNITWSDGSYNNDLVSMNNSKDDVDKLVIQKELASKWDCLDKQHGLSARKHIFPDIETSLKFIKSVCADGKEAQVFVCGSLHLVGGFLTVLEGKKE
ncbi:folylpolyglutamate synthetase [Metschnikowia bicuspidata var. bicuspidata NRRL YB-4993]|uniref:Folylpolyglutamate synthase n=1 Tax=Metschnikowia bicuspidata var. bicuspidata NRRL YB-4993 TaxID=869754 RepID=A0A1A0HKP9_9ASCO|nr:folylpolyglutamate synthetase [Metschnikowia bicuspidata var. bicuspidata NRRL YB-4993]OBA24566.1 folylpolyglutamate synthetase [Metschnikowia bicuspidata var. bicuspidata NRRL YB-4993]